MCNEQQRRGIIIGFPTVCCDNVLRTMPSTDIIQPFKPFLPLGKKQRYGETE